MNQKKKTRRARGLGSDSGLDLAISRFTNSLGFKDYDIIRRVVSLELTLKKNNWSLIINKERSTSEEGPQNKNTCLFHGRLLTSNLGFTHEVKKVFFFKFGAIPGTLFIYFVFFLRDIH